MLTALVLASVTQFLVMPEPVVFETQTTTYQQYFNVPVVRAAPMVTYSLPAAFYMNADPFMGAYPPYMGRRMVIKNRGPFFRGKTVIRY